MGVSLPVQSLMPKATLAGQVNQTANLLQKSCSDFRYALALTFNNGCWF